jgi:hypothetical protein
MCIDRLLACATICQSSFTFRHKCSHLHRARWRTITARSAAPALRGHRRCGLAFADQLAQVPDRSGSGWFEWKHEQERDTLTDAGRAGGELAIELEGGAGAEVQPQPVAICLVREA